MFVIVFIKKDFCEKRFRNYLAIVSKFLLTFRPPYDFPRTLHMLVEQNVFLSLVSLMMDLLKGVLVYGHVYCCSETSGSRKHSKRFNVCFVSF